MSDEESLVAVVAHALLNDLAAIQGLLATARAHLEPTTPRNDRADYLLQLTELKAISVVDSLRRYAWGVEPSDGRQRERDAQILDLRGRIE